MSGSYGVAPQPQKRWFTPHIVGESLDYTFDISTAIAVGSDIVSNLSVQIAPSGAGEMVASNLSVNGTLATITVTGGQPTRIYTILFAATMTDGRVYYFVVNQMVAAVFVTDQAPAPPSTGYGSTMTWTYAPITTNGQVALLPINAVLRAIYLQNTTANIVTGGINIGSTLNGVDIAVSVPVGANALVNVSGASILATWFSATAAQGIFISAVTAWNGASLNVRLEYDL